MRSTRGRNRVGRKITGIEPLPGENKVSSAPYHKHIDGRFNSSIMKDESCLFLLQQQILVTSNDSRIRLYDLRDLSLSMKYKGYVNSSSQIKASFRWGRFPFSLKHFNVVLNKLEEDIFVPNNTSDL